MAEGEKRDLVLTPDQYAYLQEVTNGLIKTHVGPTTVNQTAQDRPIRFDQDRGTFRECARLEEAVQRCPVVPEGFYLVLKNPADENGDEHPLAGSAGKISPTLKIGRKVNIPGPCMFALWPGQDAKVIRGHHLKSNQYLLVRVYNEEEARENWSSAVLKKTAEGSTGADSDEGVLSSELPEDLTVGKQLVIKGTEVSFYIPPTGISVMPEGDSYVRDALTLERLEYCILVDEDGNKRYEQGPQVVFPAPTESFITDKGNRKFRAIELNEIQGLHIKVIAPYTDLNGTEHKEGDELFITGKQTAIYFPREEHSIIRYDGKSKHFATAIPAGEGRYVMDRMTGDITMTEGPAMLLPDPRREVVVRRVLTQRQCSLWYPGNDEAAAYNEHLESLLKTAPTTRSGVISEGDFSRGTGKRSDQRRYVTAQKMLMPTSSQNSDQHVVGEEFTRGSTYTEPRTVTLDTKYQGVPSLDVWNGFAVMVRNKRGDRRVVQGPDTILLGYDDSLEVIELSTGKPKTTDNLYKTVYLRVKNNWVSDVLAVETSDHVRVGIKLQLKGDFVGDPEKWFDVENYIKQVCDHVRSVLKANARNVTIAELHGGPENFVRDCILGNRAEDGERPGMLFKQFGFHVTDVEVANVVIEDGSIRDMLSKNEHDVVASNLSLARARRQLEMTREEEAIAQETERVKQLTTKIQVGLKEEVARLSAEHRVADAQRQKAIQLHQNEILIASAQGAVDKENKLLEARAAAENLKLEQSRERQVLALERLNAETQAIVEKAEAISPELALAVRQLAEAKRFSELVSNFGEMAAVKGIGTVAAAEQVLDFLPENYFQDQKQKRELKLTDGSDD